MINKNFPLKFKKAEAYPFLLRPTGKNYLWGGNRLNDDFAKNINLFPLAETWECSTHPDGPSIVASGEFCGMSLKEVLFEHPEYLGTHVRPRGDLPILIKLIDANKDLSIQVHPDDTYAMKYEHGQLGKSEMWYVLDATRDAKLVYGFSHTVDKNMVRQSIEKGTVERYLQKVSVKRDDVFFVEARTIHAIGEGVLIAEIQENSNITYRLYDYDRVDETGKRRELHIEKALDVANLQCCLEPMQPMRVLKYRRGCASELLCRCKHFQVERLLINTERYRELVSYSSTEISFQVLLCIGGCGTLFYGEGEELCFFKGDCIFIPADSVEIKIHGKTQFLNVKC